ncbi:alpha/beta fold hydrolase [Clostridium sp. CM028]|uniref:thioesterase II family protein n=1 Tax=unclassified Clostridium TaxID=2614128 RepID=UPI001C6EC480|nr:MULTISPECIES: alpha/beta fold hydrolase [unclassified Clostridium]MBW9145943.1 alpha/beta fold hydrolase [Clostridium sp. CM027]MBW9149630.1 alpha/beta fold hydrolase [Clostridium sp. CM028]UVE40918.1 thioesterase [Clostridium sp. CM027]WLC61585.1 thioesterase [Clostridium sp. CM028]
MKVKLFCIPYAGASATVYLKWKKQLNKNIEVHAVELPGRGLKANEQLCTNIDDIVEEVFKEVSQEIDEYSEYAILGHSMGGLIAYELYYKLMKSNFKRPVHIFISGSKAPQLRIENRDSYKLPLDKFKELILKYGLTTSNEIFINNEVMDFFLPILRADFKIGDTYNYIKKEKKIESDMTVLVGTKDESMSIDEANAWEELVTSNFRLKKFNSGHFFINDYEDDVIEDINNTLLSKMN